MSHYAQCNKTANADGLHEVINVVVVNTIEDEGPGKSESDGIALMEDVCGSDYLYVKTSINTQEGKHLDPDTDEDDSEEKPPLRKNMASVGNWYDPVRDAFYVKKPFPSWVFVEDRATWISPIGNKPDDGKSYMWNEDTKKWDVRIPD